MKTWVRKTLSVGVLAAGALLFAPGAAHADSRQVTGSNVGALNGTQIAVPVQVPINVVGNSLGILGVADARGAGVNNLEHGRRGDRGPRAVQATGSNFGLLNGTQAYLPVTVPVNVVGNAAAIGGFASAQGAGVNRTESTNHRDDRRWDSPNQFTGSNFGVGNGTQIYAPVDVPINVCGNSLAILGFAQSSAVCANDTSGHRGHRGFGRNESGRGGHGGTQVTGSNFGIANGTQLLAPISLPLNLAGNSAALLGSSSSRAVAVNESARDRGDDITQATGSNFGILNGTQIAVPISVPINACGNALGVLGAAQSSAACVNDRGGRSFRGFGDDDFDGDHGHGRPGHHHGDKDWDDNDGDHGDVDDDKYKGDGGVRGDQKDYSDDVAEEPADDLADDTDEEPAANDDGYVSPAATGSKTKSTGGRESASLSTVTDTVGGLGLLNTLR
ncbi:chaplin [Actinoplanes sp. TRM 88003]|uniref:Chaplin n=1 Tax=Paractinoplanes aksuensis TaxID=2939490 RepID=A0ABT1E381_9ACTN|nr:chaplin family protein [Actinoplanes aksuensis]MCO8277593.1 chaplin [Actinoplanes aksuensis]